MDNKYIKGLELMGYPLITVIVPIYNIEKYVEKCVNSIIRQTFSNIEILLIDDGSLDSCPDICDELAKTDERIRVIHKENGGLSDSRNVGIEESHGEYICFVDGDDYIDPKFIESLYSAIITSKADLAICDFKRVDENGNGMLNVKFPSFRNEVLNKLEFYKRMESKGGYRYIVAWNKMYSKKAIGLVRFPKGKIHEDEATIHHIIHNCDRIVSTSDALYCYVIRRGSIMGQGLSIKRLDYIEAISDRIFFYSQNGYGFFVDAKLLDLLYYYYSIRGLFRKSNADRIKELDLLLKETIFFNKKNIRSLRTRLAAASPHFYVFLSKVHRFFLKHYQRFAKKSLFFGFARRKKEHDAFVNDERIKKLYSKPQRAVFLDTPLHGNLGDHAICVSEKEIIESCYAEPVLEFTHVEWKNYKKIIKTGISDDAIIFLPGGGFIGSLWKNEHEVVVDILNEFRANKIIVFPQTVFFDGGDHRLEKQFIAICKKCVDLHIFVREKKSYQVMKKMGLAGICRLMPDSVLSYGFRPAEVERLDRVLLCLRDDKEKKQNADVIEKVLLDGGIGFDRISTVVDEEIEIADRKSEVDKKIEEYSRYSLVITDRLHSMLFSLLARTPCIAFDNSSKKVSGVYEWIKGIDGVICTEEGNLSVDLINLFMRKKMNVFDSAKFFSMLAEALKDLM